ncbi:MAG TPA: RNA polymerase sigma factor [Frankiaceae bacterium]|nr:RNA polymerase sigma factor [Frankiaceae bacterium]
MTTDVELLDAVAAGSRTALEELYRRHSAWLVLRLSRRCSDGGLVDETVQDTFVAVWRSAGKYAGQGDVGAWVWGIAIRRLVDALRRSPRATAVPLAEPRETERSAEERVLEGVQYGALGGALNRLSPELRAVVEATVLDGLSTKEAATLLGIPAGTVKTRMMRARAALREELA